MKKISIEVYLEEHEDIDLHLLQRKLIHDIGKTATHLSSKVSKIETSVESEKPTSKDVYHFLESGQSWKPGIVRSTISNDAIFLSSICGEKGEKPLAAIKVSDSGVSIAYSVLPPKSKSLSSSSFQLNYLH